MPEKITLYTCGTPNGFKVSIYLELLGLKYDVVPVNIAANEQKEPWFLELNPNGRIPTLKDDSTGVTISETAAIITYLADTYDTERKFSYEYKTKDYYKQLEITYFQMAGLGPMQGQAHHFIMFAKEDISYGKERYREETKRLYLVVNEYLKRNGTEFLVGDHISIADVVIFPWTLGISLIDIEINDYPFVKKWIQKLALIPEVRKGIQIPTPPRHWPDYVEPLN